MDLIPLHYYPTFEDNIDEGPIDLVLIDPKTMLLWAYWHLPRTFIPLMNKQIANVETLSCCRLQVQRWDPSTRMYISEL